MKLVHEFINSTIKLNLEDRVNILIVENQSFMNEIIYDLYDQTQKRPGKFVLAVNDAPVEVSDYLELIIDPFSLKINKTTIINKVLKSFNEISQNEDFLIKTKELYSIINNYVYMLSDQIDNEIEFLYEYEISRILKAMSMKFKEEYTTIQEKLVEYMLLIREWDRNKCFVLVNLRDYITNEEIDEFYKTVLYNKLSVLIIGTSNYPKSKFEEKVTIDQELCEF